MRVQDRSDDLTFFSDEEFRLPGLPERYGTFVLCTNFFSMSFIHRKLMVACFAFFATTGHFQFHHDNGDPIIVSETTACRVVGASECLASLYTRTGFGSPQGILNVMIRFFEIAQFPLHPPPARPTGPTTLLPLFPPPSRPPGPWRRAKVRAGSRRFPRADPHFLTRTLARTFSSPRQNRSWLCGKS